MLFERKKRKSDPDHQYIRTTLDFDDRPQKLASIQFLTIVLEALRQLHGEVGKAIDVEVYSFDKHSQQAVLKVPYSYVPKVWSALTCFGQWRNIPCAFRVHKVANAVTDLGTGDSWDWCEDEGV